MPTIDQNGNSFGTDMTIGTNDNEAINIITDNAKRIYIENSGNVSIGGGPPMQFNSLAYLFPSLSPKMEIITGDAFTAYNEAVVIRHSEHDSNAVSRNIGLVLKLSTEANTVESAKSCAIMLGSSNDYANYPDMNFYMGNAATPRMQILDSGSISMASLVGSGTRMVTADSAGILNATTEVTSGTYTPTVLGPATSYNAAGFKYTRIGDIVQVSGVIVVSGCTVGFNTVVITLPIASNLTLSEDVTGTISGVNIGTPTVTGTGNFVNTYFYSSAAANIGYEAINTDVQIGVELTYIVK